MSFEEKEEKKWYDNRNSNSGGSNTCSNSSTLHRHTLTGEQLVRGTYDAWTISVSMYVEVAWRNARDMCKCIAIWKQRTPQSIYTSTYKTNERSPNGVVATAIATARLKSKKKKKNEIQHCLLCVIHTSNRCRPELVIFLCFDFWFWRSSLCPLFVQIRIFTFFGCRIMFFVSAPFVTFNHSLELN